jgi:ABC-type nitrate/sulfonate/bicarbonate transport system substrate-binding protein
MTTNRRQFLQSASAVTVASAIPGWANGQTQRKVTLTNPWLPDGSCMFTFVAKNRGYYQKRGLDVEISRGFGSVAAAQAVGSGKFDFGVAALPAGIQQVTKGLPIVHLGSAHYDGTMGVIVLADSPIKSLKDLEGRKLGSTVTSGEYPFLPLFLKNAGVDASKIQRVQFDPQVRDRALLTKEVDAITGFAGSILPNFAAANVETRFFPYSGHGVKLYGMSVMTQQERLQKEPEIARAITEATLEGMALTLRNPDEALEAFLAEHKEIAMTQQGRDRIRIGTALFGLTMFVNEARKNGIGWFDPAAVKSQVDMVMNFVAAKEDKAPNMETLYTNRFTGTVKLTDAEWAAADKRFAQYKRLLGL